MTKSVFDAEVDLARVVGFIDRLTDTGALTEAYWVLFRFLYGGQLTDPVLIIACDNLLWGSVA